MESIPIQQTRYSNRSLIKILNVKWRKKLPYSLFEEVVEFIAENKTCEENLLRAALKAENVDAAKINGIISRTLDSDTTSKCH